MTAPITLESVRGWATTAARAASDKQGQDTVVLAVGPLLGVADAFVITSAANTRAVRTIAEEVELRVRAGGGPAPRAVEGLDDARWVLIDYGDFIVHVFLEEAREFYALEQLWGDGEIWAWDDAAAVAAGE